jgi:hypothetical protein
MPTTTSQSIFTNIYKRQLSANGLSNSREEKEEVPSLSTIQIKDIENDVEPKHMSSSSTKNGNSNCTSKLIGKLNKLKATKPINQIYGRTTSGNNDHETKETETDSPSNKVGKKGSYLSSLHHKPGHRSANGGGALGVKTPKSALLEKRRKAVFELLTDQIYPTGLFFNIVFQSSLFIFILEKRLNYEFFI